MFLHIGDSQIVPIKDIIGIFNLKKQDREINRQFLEYASPGGNIKEEDYDYYKSFIVTTDNIYLSPISSATLGKRKIK